MNTWQALAPVTVAAAFIFGVLLALLGGIRVPLARQLGVDERRVGGLVALFALALIPLVLVSGLLIAPVGWRIVLATGSVVGAVGLACLAVSTSYPQAVVSVLFIGVGAACLNTASAVLMPEAFFPTSRAASLNLGTTFICLGALMTPAIADLLGRLLGFRRLLGVLAALCVVPAVLVLVLGGEAPPSGGAGSLTAVLSNPTLWLAVVVFFLYSPIEGALGSWVSPYLTQLGYRERRATLWLSGFWLAFVAARLAMAWAQQKWWRTATADAWVLLVLAAAVAVALGNLVGTNQGRTGRWVLLLLGAVLGPIFPTLIGFLFEQVAPGQAATPGAYGAAYGVVYALGSTGNVLLPPVLGAYARRGSIRRAVRLPLGVALLLVAVSLVLVLVVQT